MCAHTHTYNTQCDVQNGKSYMNISTLLQPPLKIWSSLDHYGHVIPLPKGKVLQLSNENECCYRFLMHGFHVSSLQYILEVNIAESITLTSFSIPSTSLPGQFMQLRVNLLICLFKHWNQVLGLPTIVWSKEGIWCTRCIAAACATNAVNVIFRGVWIIKVDHIFDPIHICALNNIQVSYEYTACLTEIYCI